MELPLDGGHQICGEKGVCHGKDPIALPDEVSGAQGAAHSSRPIAGIVGPGV